MVSLDQIEPRTIVQYLPGTNDAVHLITEDGCYVLRAGVRGVSAKHGIKITARNVAIDLSGFSLVGVPGSLNAIHVDGVVRSSLDVGNNENWDFQGGGTHCGIRDWDGNAVHDADAQHVHAHGINISDCRDAGLQFIATASSTGESRVMV